MGSDYPSERFERKKNGAEWAAAIIVALATGAAVVTRFSALEEAKKNLVVSYSDLKDEANLLEARVHTLETSRTIEIDLNRLSSEIAALKVEVSDLRDELRQHRR